jgi:hypothetical protein
MTSSQAVFSLEYSLGTDELDPQFRPSIPLREAWLSILTDPSALLYYANEVGEPEMVLKARLFHHIRDGLTIPYPPRDP